MLTRSKQDGCQRKGYLLFILPTFGPEAGRAEEVHGRSCCAQADSAGRRNGIFPTKSLTVVDWPDPAGHHLRTCPPSHHVVIRAGSDRAAERFIT